MRILGALKTAVAAVFLARTALCLAVFHNQDAAVRRDEMLEGSHVRLGARDATLSTQTSSALHTGYPNSTVSVTATVATSNISSSASTVTASTTTSTATSTLTTTATATSGGGTTTTSTSGKELTIEIQNDRDEPINAYIGGKQRIVVNGTAPTLEPVMLRTDLNQYYPLKNVPANDSNSPTSVPSYIPLAIRIPAKSSSNVTLPDYLISGRVWIAEGDLEFRAYPGGAFSEPSGANPSLSEYNVKWGFVELNHDAGGLIINLSFVDWVSLSLGMSLTFATGQGTNTSSVPGLEAGAMQNICNDLKTQASISGSNGTHDWDKLCIYSEDGKDLLRVFSPNIDASIHRPNSTLVNYYDDYINQVWDKYQKQNLTLQLQGGSDGMPLTTPGPGQATTCSVQANSNMTCDQSDHSYPKPTTADIWGCNSGPFFVGDINATVPRDMMHSRIIPRLCAAFTRSTLLLDGGNMQPFANVTDYYSANVTNHYSRIVHNYLANGKGYSFSYDDVNPWGIDHDAAGVLAADKPAKVHIDVKGDQADK
ncbi:hypothetical protein LQW54_005393 [Pestalotiopsis sp. IQ-011]